MSDTRQRPLPSPAYWYNISMEKENPLARAAQYLAYDASEDIMIIMMSITRGERNTSTDNEINYAESRRKSSEAFAKLLRDL